MNGTLQPYRRPKPKFPWYNQLWFGAVLGFIAPIIVFLALKESNYSHLDLLEFLNNAIQYKLMSRFISQAVIINLGVFFSLLMMELDNSARGVIFSTFFYGIFIIWFKFF